MSVIVNDSQHCNSRRLMPYLTNHRIRTASSPHTHSNQRWQRLTRWKTCSTVGGLAVGRNFIIGGGRSDLLDLIVLSMMEEKLRNVLNGCHLWRTTRMSLVLCLLPFDRNIHSHNAHAHEHNMIFTNIHNSISKSRYACVYVCATETISLMFSIFAYFSPSCRMQIEFETFMV